MSAPTNWRHKDEWTRRGRSFLVEISRHEVPPPMDGSTGPHRWCVYAYVYPQHPHFAAFSGDKMWQPAALELPLHAYPSYLRIHRDNAGAITSYEVGADYNHLHDEPFTRSAEMPPKVLRDAEALFAWLEQRATPKRQADEATAESSR